MLVITVELIPGGFLPLRRTIARMEIANQSDLAEVSNYSFEVVESANHLTGEPARTAAGEIMGHPRRQSVWALVAAIAVRLGHAERSNR